MHIWCDGRMSNVRKGSISLDWVSSVFLAFSNSFQQKKNVVICSTQVLEGIMRLSQRRRYYCVI